MPSDDAPDPSDEAARTVARVADRAEAAAREAAARETAAQQASSPGADGEGAAEDADAPPDASGGERPGEAPAGAASAAASAATGRLAPATRALLDEARHHLDAAWHTSDAGTDVPADARLRQVKRAVLAGMRPVTSHQVPFNQELVVAVDRLAQVVEDVARRMDGVEEAGDATLRRVQAGIATVDVQVEDLDQELRAALARLDDLTATVHRLLDDHAETRHALAEVRSRQDIVLRSAREALSSGQRLPEATGTGLDPDADAALLRRLGSVGRPEPATLTAWAEALAARVAEAAGDAPVLDMLPDHGEWLEVWRHQGLDATGVEDDAARHGALAERGLPVTHAAPLAHLTTVAPGSLGAVTAAVLADVRPLTEVAALADAAREALRPGGLLVLAAADPAHRTPDDPQWADPRRRPLDHRVLSLLALERGFAEAEVVPLGDGPPRAYAVLARTAGPGTAPG